MGEPYLLRRAHHDVVDDDGRATTVELEHDGTDDVHLARQLHVPDGVGLVLRRRVAEDDVLLHPLDTEPALHGAVKSSRSFPNWL